MGERDDALTAPSIEECAGQVERNAYYICLGRDVKGEGAYIIVSLPNNHVLLLGGSRMGKSSLAAQIINQVTRTHDPDYLQIALLDSENLICNLFADLPHVVCIKLGGGKTMKGIAHNTREVAAHLGYLVALMNERYTLSPEEVACLPKILVYAEELVTVGWYLRSNPIVFARMIQDVAELAMRGLKVGIHLMMCIQAPNSLHEFRETVQQCSGVALAFCVQPSVARAAGFHSDLLTENYLAKKPGQFVLEFSDGYATLGLAPYYDVKAELLSLSGSGIVGHQALHEKEV